MATPKIDRILDEFGYRIGDPNTYSGTILQDGIVLTALEKMAYVNKAMFKLFNLLWESVKGNIVAFSNLCPELTVMSANISAVAVVVDTRKVYIYALATPHLDFFDILSAHIMIAGGATYLKVWQRHLFSVAMSQKLPQYTLTLPNRAIIHLNGIMYFFPTYASDAVLTALENIRINYIKQPLNPTTGAFLTQNGSYDSPFYDQWNSKIAEIAEELFRIDAQER